MIGILRSFLLFIVIVGGVGFIVYQLAHFILSINNGRNRLEKETFRLKNKLKDLPAEPIPFDDDELKLLSGEKIELVSNGKSILGSINTIYSETFVKFGKIVLPSTGYMSIVAQLSNHEYTYLDFKDHVNILKDGVFVGSINYKGEFKSKEGDFTATIDYLSKAEYLPIIINGKELGQIINPEFVTGINTRAFQFLRKMKEEEKEVFLINSLYYLLQ